MIGWVLLGAAVWLLVGLAVALLVGGGVRIADEREQPDDEALLDELLGDTPTTHPAG